MVAASIRSSQANLAASPPSRLWSAGLSWAREHGEWRFLAYLANGGSFPRRRRSRCLGLRPESRPAQATPRPQPRRCRRRKSRPAGYATGRAEQLRGFEGVDYRRLHSAGEDRKRQRIGRAQLAPPNLFEGKFCGKLFSDSLVPQVRQDESAITKLDGLLLLRRR